MYNRNDIGPSTETYGTPYFISPGAGVPTTYFNNLLPTNQI
jgi:hypothetical protein